MVQELKFQNPAEFPGWVMKPTLFKRDNVDKRCRENLRPFGQNFLLCTLKNRLCNYRIFFRPQGYGCVSLSHLQIFSTSRAL